MFKIKIRRPDLLDRAETYVSAPPCPEIVLQLSVPYLSGVGVGVKEKTIKKLLIAPLAPGLVEPHFERTNFPDRAALLDALKEGLAPLKGSGQRTALLFPEASVRTFVMSFDSLPASEAERRNVIVWRAKKQMPVLPEDVRLTYQVVASGSSVKVMAALSRESIVREYESLFADLGFEIGVVTTPTLSLMNVVDWETRTNALLVNLDQDSLGLAAVVRSEVALYRVKPLGGVRPEVFRAADLVKEIENTIHFIEDREKQTIETLWFRSGLLNGGASLESELGQRLSVPFQPVRAASLSGLASGEQEILAPLIGQIP